MNSAWFDVAVAWLPGAILGGAAGLFGALASWARGSVERARRSRSIVRASYWLIVLGACLMLVLGVIALTARQPREVWYALLQPGALGLLLFGPIAFRAAHSGSHCASEA